MQASTYFVGAILLALTGCFGEGAQVQEPPQAVRATAPRSGPVVEGRTYLGELAPERSVRVVAQVPGTVVGFDADEGAQVAAGATLVRVTAPDVAARVERVRAERGRAEAERDFHHAGSIRCHYCR